MCLFLPAFVLLACAHERALSPLCIPPPPPPACGLPSPAQILRRPRAAALALTEGPNHGRRRRSFADGCGWMWRHRSCGVFLPRVDLVKHLTR